MRYEDYTKKHEKIFNPINEIPTLLSVMSILDLIADELDEGNFKEKLKILIENEKDNLRDMEVKEE